nr:hypothetical protein [Tanacetum cinerariifolium]
DNKIDNKLEVICTVIDENGNEVVELNDEMIEIRCQKWQKTAFGFFVGCHVTYRDVFFFKFHDEGGMDEVVKNGPWMVNNKPLFVQRWKVGMILDSIGKPIIMDDITAKMCAKGEGRLGFARILIEIDAGKKIKNEIKVMYKGN